MCDKKLINSHPNLETLPLDELYNSSNIEYKAFYENLFSDFFDKYPNFAITFGSIGYEFALGEWFYTLEPPDVEMIYIVDKFIQAEKMPNREFYIGFLSKQEIDELLKKSEEELLRKPKEKCIDYLYEVVKNHPYKPYYDPDVIY